MSAPRFLALVLAGLIALFAGFNLFTGVVLDSVRLDLTERGLYRLSPGTLEVLERIEEPVQLDFVYSREEAARYPAIRAYAARVREMLRTIAARSDGMVRLDEVDPEPFSPAEDRAIAAGLEPVPTEEGGQLFFGLIGHNAVDDRRTVAFFDPAEEARLEYEIVRLIAELDRARTPVIAVISSLPFAPDAQGASPNPVIDELAAAYDLVWLDETFEAIPEADALFLLHPPALTEAQTYLVDQFALRTGRVLAALDPMAHVALKPGPDGLPPLRAERDSALPRLLPAWGAAYDPTVVAMDRRHGLPVQINEGGRTRMRAYPLWFSVPPGGMSTGFPPVAALSRGVNVGSPGVLRPLEGAATAFSAILATSPEGARLDADLAAGSPSPDELAAIYQIAPDAPLALAARLSGPLASAFPDGPPAGELALDPAAHRARSDGAAEIILIADADLFDPAFFINPDPVQGDRIVADNLALILNLADALAGDPALVSLRSRSSSARPMVRVEDLRAEAEARYLALQEELSAELAAAEAELEALNRTGAGSALSGAAAAETGQAEALRARILEARERLRDIERGFRVEIDALERALLFWTVWVPPVLVLLAGFVFLLLRRRRPR
ncbi:hypothetical protein E5163_09350 [Marinicauda algicola]|uniref:Uncharacterized protein n=1 Tax=Marinicauda algicola TaxID=2029849 RepID=A0A4S2H212_9PROT|nr:GldG family protein [Marinicauda algicola]TGY89311.1 hypothetical protein E5163_09350 [Marinicauda algicola]